MTYPPDIMEKAHELADKLDKYCTSYRSLNTDCAENLIAAALSEARAVPQWQPIETAPRDGAWILAYWPTMSITEYPTVVFADDCSNHDIWFKPNDLDFGCVYPTHWIPLPRAPGPPIAGGEG